MTKYHVCLKYRIMENLVSDGLLEPFIFNTQISIEVRGNDQNLLFNLMEEIKELSEFRTAEV